jgi:hypothetical protein
VLRVPLFQTVDTQQDAKHQNNQNFSTGDVRFSSPYSGVYSLAHNGGLITCDNETQKGATLPAQVVINVQMVMHVLFPTLSGNPSHTNFLEVKPVTDDVTGRIVTTLPAISLSHPSIVHNQLMDLYKVPVGH